MTDTIFNSYRRKCSYYNSYEGPSTKHTLILTAEIFCISPAAYRIIRNSGTICLPNDKLVRQSISRTSNDDNLTLIIQELNHEQRFVNVLFDEVKLTLINENNTT